MSKLTRTIHTMMFYFAEQSRKRLCTGTKKATRVLSYQPRVEELEPRRVFATWEGLGNYTFRDDTPAAVIKDVVPGQRINLIAIFHDNHPESIQTARISYQGQQFSLDSINKAKEVIFTTNSSSFAIDAEIFDFSHDLVVISLAKERVLPDIVPERIGLHLDNRTVNFDIVVKDAPIPANIKVPVKYYWVDEANVGQEISLPESEPAKYLSNVGKDKKVTLAVPFRYFANKPGWTSRIRIVVNLDKTIEESSYKNSLNFLPADIVALPPRLNELGQFQIGYRVKNHHFFNTNDNLKDEPVTVQAWWSKDGTWDGRIGDKAVFRVAMNPQSGVDQYVRPSAAEIEQLKNPPGGAKFIITRVDNLNLVPEPNEKDNNSSGFALFDANVQSLTWDGNGGAKLVVNLDNRNNIPPGASLRVEFFWAAEDGTRFSAGRALKPFFLSGSRSMGRTLREGLNSWTLDAEDLPTPTPQQIVAFGQTVTKLVAVLKHDGGPATADSKSSTYELDLPLVSLELFDAPAAASKLERVKLWLQKHESVILKEARIWNIDPRAIAGAIAWEAVHNIHSLEDWTAPLRNRMYGPGKIHYKEGLFSSFRDPYPLVVKELESLGLLSARDGDGGELRGRYVRTPAGAIHYIASYLGTFADVYEQYGWPTVRRNPAILGTLFQGSIYENLSVLANELPQRAAGMPNAEPPRPADGDITKFMGAWITKNNQFLRSALPRYAADLNKPAEDRRWWPRVGTFIYTPKQIDAPTRFNVPVTELSWALADLSAGATRVKGFYVRSTNGGAPEGILNIRGDRLVYTLPRVGLPSGDIYYSVEVGNRVIYGGRIKMRIDIPQPR